MATTFSIVAELLADPRKFAATFRSTLRDAQAQTAKTADAMGRRLGRSLSRGAAKLASRGINTALGGFTAAVAAGARDAFTFNATLDDIRIQAGATANTAQCFTQFFIVE